MTYTIILNNKYLMRSSDINRVRSVVRVVNSDNHRLALYKGAIHIGSKLTKQQALTTLDLAENVELVEDGAMVNLQLAMGKGGV